MAPHRARGTGPAGKSRSPRSGPPAAGDARRVAYDVLRAVAERGAYANIALPSMLRDRGVARREAALATELAYGTLRGLGTYDEVLRACSDRGLEGIDPPLLDVLRLGTHQLLATRIPDHAAVGETVAVSRAALDGRRARFVNAVLRKVATRDLAGWLDIVAPSEDADPVGYLAVAYSHPRWIVAAVRDGLGGDLSETRRALAAHNVAAPVTLAATPGRCDRDELLAAGAVAGEYSPYAGHLPEGDPAGVPAVREGRAGVQDEGSQLVALAMARAGAAGGGDEGDPHVGPGNVLVGREDRENAAWLDLCAGPGGKAALLGGLAARRGSRVLAVDRQPHRARLVRRRAPDVSVIVADGRAPAWPDGAFDRVLVDVPCSGLGALRRRPELRWRRVPGDIAAIRPLQRDLLASALRAARPGGLVAYVTCSPHLAETGVVVDDVVGARDDVERVDARPSLRELPHLGPGPYVQLWPHRHGTDAMFLALLRVRGPG